MADSANVELLRHAYERFNHEDFDGILEFMAPDIVIERYGMLEPLVGHEAVRSFVEPDAFEWIRFEVEDVQENGDRIFVRVRIHARGRATGLEIDQLGFHVWTVRDGQGVHLYPAADEREALIAAGLQNADP